MAVRKGSAAIGSSEASVDGFLSAVGSMENSSVSRNFCISCSALFLAVPSFRGRAPFVEPRGERGDRCFVRPLAFTLTILMRVVVTLPRRRDCSQRLCEACTRARAAARVRRGGARAARAGGGAALGRQAQANAVGRARLWVVPVSEAADGQRARAAARVRRTQAVVQRMAGQPQASLSCAPGSRFSRVMGGTSRNSASA